MATHHGISYTVEQIPLATNDPSCIDNYLDQTAVPQSNQPFGEPPTNLPPCLLRIEATYTGDDPQGVDTWDLWLDPDPTNDDCGKAFLAINGGGQTSLSQGCPPDNWVVDPICATDGSLPIWLRNSTSTTAQFDVFLHGAYLASDSPSQMGSPNPWYDAQTMPSSAEFFTWIGGAVKILAHRASDAGVEERSLWLSCAVHQWAKDEGAVRTDQYYRCPGWTYSVAAYKAGPYASGQTPSDQGHRLRVTFTRCGKIDTQTGEFYVPDATTNVPIDEVCCEHDGSVVPGSYRVPVYAATFPFLWQPDPNAIIPPTGIGGANVALFPPSTGDAWLGAPKTKPHVVRRFPDCVATDPTCFEGMASNLMHIFDVYVGDVPRVLYGHPLVDDVTPGELVTLGIEDDGEANIAPHESSCNVRFPADPGSTIPPQLSGDLSLFDWTEFTLSAESGGIKSTDAQKHKRPVEVKPITTEAGCLDRCCGCAPVSDTPVNATYVADGVHHLHTVCQEFHEAVPGFGLPAITKSLLLYFTRYQLDLSAMDPDIRSRAGTLLGVIPTVKIPYQAGHTYAKLATRPYLDIDPGTIGHNYCEDGSPIYLGDTCVACRPPGQVGPLTPTTLPQGHRGIHNRWLSHHAPQGFFDWPTSTHDCTAHLGGSYQYDLPVWLPAPGTAEATATYFECGDHCDFNTPFILPARSCSSLTYTKIIYNMPVHEFANLFPPGIPQPFCKGPVAGGRGTMSACVPTEWATVPSEIYRYNGRRGWDSYDHPELDPAITPLPDPVPAGTVMELPGIWSCPFFYPSKVLHPTTGVSGSFLQTFGGPVDCGATDQEDFGT